MLGGDKDLPLAHGDTGTRMGVEGNICGGNNRDVGTSDRQGHAIAERDCTLRRVTGDGDGVESALDTTSIAETDRGPLLRRSVSPGCHPA